MKLTRRQSEQNSPNYRYRSCAEFNSRQVPSTRQGRVCGRRSWLFHNNMLGSRMNWSLECTVTLSSTQRVLRGYSKGTRRALCGYSGGHSAGSLSVPEYPPKNPPEHPLSAAGTQYLQRVLKGYSEGRRALRQSARRVPFEYPLSTL